MRLLRTGVDDDNDDADDYPEWVNLEEIKRLTGFERYTADDVFEDFARVANDDGVIAFPAFYDVALSYIDRNDDLSDMDRERAEMSTHASLSNPRFRRQRGRRFCRARERHLSALRKALKTRRRPPASSCTM